MHVSYKNVTSFDSFGVEQIPKEIKKFIENKFVITNIFRTQAHDWVMCRYVCIEFIGFILKGLLEYKNPFSPNDYKNNNKT